MRFLFSLLILVFLTVPALAFESTKAKQAIIIDFETGQMLLAKNEDEKMPTSSMSKVMTSYMIFDAVKNGRLNMHSEMLVSEKAWAKGGSKMFVEQGKKIKVEDLLRGVIVQSGNDATIVLAEGLSGSEERFSQEITAKAQEMGMKNSNFMNASGWPDPDHYSTAKDLSIMARRLIEDFPDYFKMFSEKEFTYSNIKQQNRNPLLYRDIGADGLKTGHTEIAGYGLIGTAKKNGRRVLMVVNGLESEKERADESVRLIEWALNDFINKNLFKKGQPVTQAHVAMGQLETVPLIVNDDIQITVPKVPNDSFSVELVYKTPLIAPLKAGDEVGTLKIIIPTISDKFISYPLVVGRDVEKVGFFAEIWMKIKYHVLKAL